MVERGDGGSRGEQASATVTRLGFEAHPVPVARRHEQTIRGVCVPVEPSHEIAKPHPMRFQRGQHVLAVVLPHLQQQEKKEALSFSFYKGIVRCPLNSTRQYFASLQIPQGRRRTWC